MPTEIVEFALLLAGWVVAFLLGKELHTGFVAWRARTSANAPRTRR